ncbi:MAG: YraN family protein [Granulosicoccus sp.]|nr:YraN family protein [Granulosicoccus sp.]
MKTQRIGNDAEAFARTWLEKRGLTFIEANFHCRYGEIDLVMIDQSETVFVEVRFRSHPDYGSATDSVDQFKQLKLVRAAKDYLQRHGLQDSPARIDVVGINAYEDHSVEWIRNAVEDSA